MGGIFQQQKLELQNHNKTSIVTFADLSLRQKYLENEKGLG